jgi:hypothetical protein
MVDVLKAPLNPVSVEIPKVILSAKIQRIPEIDLNLRLSSEVFEVDLNNSREMVVLI